MGRLAGLYGALAICLALTGGAVWLRASLAAEFARGERHGRMAAALESRVLDDARRAQLDAARADAERQALAIDQDEDAMKESLHDLEKRRTADGGDVCLDAGLVRALNRIGRDPARDHRP